MQMNAFPVGNRASERIIVTLPVRGKRPVWRLSLQLSHPTTWLLPMAAFACGALASGKLAFEGTQLLRLALGLLLAGPLLAGMNAVVNSLFDRDIDAINHPNRPLPSGRISVNAVISQIGLMGMLILFYAQLLDRGLGTRLNLALGLGTAEERGLFYLVLGTMGLIYAVNAPPFALRRNTWWSGIFFGLLAVGFPWVLGHVLFATLTLSSGLFAGCFGFGAVGLLILKALNKVDRERRVGIRSLSALLGREVGLLIGAMLVDTAILAAAILAAPQGMLTVAILVALLVIQIALQVVLLGRNWAPNWSYFAAAGIFACAMAAASASVPGVSLQKLLLM